jgi:integrase
MSDRIPSYRLHGQSGQAVVTLPDGAGRRRDVLLGTYGTKASREEYLRVIAEWEAQGRRVTPVEAEPGGLMINDLILAFLTHARGYYRDATGKPTRETENITFALKPLKELFGRTAVVEFGPLRFKAFRDELVRRGLSRGVVNQRCGVIKRVIGWAVGEEMIPAGIAHALREVPGLKRGRTDACEPAPVGPVPQEDLLAALPFMPPPVAAMAQLQQLSGARAGEIVIIRGCDLNTDGATWTYTPSKHKAGYRGLPRTIHLGPKAQVVLREFLKDDPDAFLFSPASAEAERNTLRRAGRTLPLWAPHIRARSKSRKRPPGMRYTVASYRRAINRSCRKAGVPKFATHRLRHSFGTMARKAFDLDHARASLGHATADVSQVYCERDAALAQRVAAKIG